MNDRNDIGSDEEQIYEKYIDDTPKSDNTSRVIDENVHVNVHPNILLQLEDWEIQQKKELEATAWSAGLSSSTSIRRSKEISSKRGGSTKKHKHGLCSKTYDWEDFKHKCTISQQQFDEILEVFREYDVNDDGVISRREFYRMLRSIGQNPREKEVDKLFDQLDTNNNNKIEFDELIKLVETVMNSSQEDDETKSLMKYLYTAFDKSIGMVPYQSKIYHKRVHTTKIRGLDVQEVLTILENVKAVDQHEEHQHQIKILQKQAKNAQKASKSSRKKYGKVAVNPNKRASISCFADRRDAELFEEFKREMWDMADMKSGFSDLGLEYERDLDGTLNPIFKSKDGSVTNVFSNVRVQDIENASLADVNSSTPMSKSKSKSSSKSKHCSRGGDPGENGGYDHISFRTYCEWLEID